MDRTIIHLKTIGIEENVVVDIIKRAAVVVVHALRRAVIRLAVRLALARLRKKRTRIVQESFTKMKLPTISVGAESKDGGDGMSVKNA